ncbi:hypothetical protein BJY01DRAFT_207065, partial [Aspergillus pseudoustus]
MDRVHCFCLSSTIYLPVLYNTYLFLFGAFDQSPTDTFGSLATLSLNPLVICTFFFVLPASLFFVCYHVYLRLPQISGPLHLPMNLISDTMPNKEGSTRRRPFPFGCVNRNISIRWGRFDRSVI